jgi:tellurite resistance protein
MGKKRSSLGWLVLVLISAAIWLLVEYGKTILAIIGLFILLWLIRKVIINSQKKAVEKYSSSQSAVERKISISRQHSYTNEREFSTNGDDFWVPIGRSVKIGDYELGNMIYFGHGLASVRGGEPEPALIDKGLPLAVRMANCSVRHLPYWPSYSSASPEARSSYLQWLSAGRKDPDADLGYVFLFFYGLERRALNDSKDSFKAKLEIPNIQNEVERLLGIYKNSGSFQHYAGTFRDLLSAKNFQAKLYEQAPPALHMDRWMTFEHKLGLAQCASDNKPLPKEWAYIWLRGDPNSRLRTPARRCPKEFRDLFEFYYKNNYGEGIILPVNKTRLRLDYRVASPTFGHMRNDYGGQFNLPDVSVLSTPINELHKIGEKCCSELDAFSRNIGKDRANIGNLDTLVELPLLLWPEEYRQRIQELRTSLFDRSESDVISFEKLLAIMPKWEGRSKQKYISLCRILSEAGIGIEPDVRYGGMIPEPGSDIALFLDDNGTVNNEARPEYTAAALTLRLAVSVAGADGEITDEEEVFLTRKMEEWLHLTESEKKRLHASLHLMLLKPGKALGTKKRFEGLPEASRDTIATFLANVSQADSEVNPAEISKLEKIFNLLGLDPKLVFSKVHFAATEPVIVQPGSDEKMGYAIPNAPIIKASRSISLDASKIAYLQSDTERVSTILSSIFTEGESEIDSIDNSKQDTPTEEPLESSLMGLDSTHSSFLLLLMARTNWTRSELEEISLDREIMLDGAIEHINEAAYSTFDKPMLEGDDPIYLNEDIVREVIK